MEPDEILTEIVFPLPDKSSAGVYLKLEKVAGDFAIASAAVQLSLDANGVCNEIGIGVTGAHSMPQKASRLKLCCVGRKLLQS